MRLVITPELKLTLNLLYHVDPEYVSDLLLALIAHFDRSDHIAVEDMPEPVAIAFRFWIAPDRKEQITVGKYNINEVV